MRGEWAFVVNGDERAVRERITSYLLKVGYTHADGGDGLTFRRGRSKLLAFLTTSPAKLPTTATVDIISVEDATKVSVSLDVWLPPGSLLTEADKEFWNVELDGIEAAANGSRHGSGAEIEANRAARSSSIRYIIAIAMLAATVPLARAIESSTALNAGFIIVATIPVTWVVMSTEIEFEQKDSVGWQEAWRVLGSERCQSVFPMLGIPPGMALRPAILCVASQQAWDAHAVEGLPGVPSSRVDPTFDGAYDRAFRSLLEELFTRLSDHYGQAEAAALYSWVRRHFIDDEQRTWWSKWHSVFIDLRSVAHPKIPVPLPANVLRRVQALVDARLTLEAMDEARERARAVLAREKSSFDERALRPEPDDEKEIDLTSTLVLIVLDERTRELWREFQRQLTPAEQQALFDWARQEAAAYKYPLPTSPPHLE